jgi:hypothetical protein
MAVSTWRARFLAAPLWLLFVYYTVAFGILTFLIPGSSATHSVPGAVVGGVLFGAFMTLWTTFLRRR